MDGYMLMRQIRTLLSDRGKHIPAIAVTAYAGDVNQQEAFAAGFQRHLSKPIDSSQVIAVIRDLCQLPNLASQW
jgi:CheY-like chemotaxis protein